MKKSRKASAGKSDKAEIPAKIPDQSSVKESPTTEPIGSSSSDPKASIQKPEKTYRMQLVAGRMNDALRNEIITMWVEGGALHQDEAERRSKEVVIAIRDHSNRMIGVTTSHPVMVPNVGVCWFLRMFLMPEHRGFLGKNGLGLPARMLGATMAFLAESSASIPKNRPVGVMMILENKKLLTPRWKRVFESRGWQFVGTAPNGAPALFRPLVYHVPEGTVSGGDRLSS